MRLFTPLLAIPLLAFGLAACLPYSSPDTSTLTKENKLAMAGFKQRPIKTESQLADFRSIPPHLIRPATYKGKMVYVYADPNICGCLYIGNAAAYNTYIQGAQTRFVREEYKESTTDNGYSASPWMLDGGPWDDADMYGMYIN